MQFPWQHTHATYLVFSDPVPVKQHEIEADAVQPLGPLGDLEDKALVENGVQGPLLDVRLLLGDALVVEKQIDFDVGVCNQALDTRQKLVRRDIPSRRFHLPANPVTSIFGKLRALRTTTVNLLAAGCQHSDTSNSPRPWERICKEIKCGAPINRLTSSRWHRAGDKREREKRADLDFPESAFLPHVSLRD